MIHTSTTPSGIPIEFEDGLPDENGKSKRRSYLVDGEKFVSVTTVLGILEKPGLPWAAEKLTIAGAVEVAREGELLLDVDGALSAMGARGLRFRQQWDKKAEGGTVTHEELLRIATGQQLLELDSFSPDQQGFVRGVSDWYADTRPQILDSELMVASVTHGYAGRLDLRAKLGDARWLIDLKTTETLPTYKNGQVKPPYTEHVLQLAAYELAAEECGYGETDHQGVLRVDSTGTYDFTPSWVEPESFLKILDAYRELKDADAQKPKYQRAAA